LFSESNTRFLCEVLSYRAHAFEALLNGVPHAKIGEVNDSGRLQIVANDSGEILVDADLKTLKEVWQKPMRW